MNGVALLAISQHPRFAAHRFAGPAIAAGTTLFSLSIVALTLDRNTCVTWGIILPGMQSNRPVCRFKFLGPVTPLGGMMMIAGYVLLESPSKNVHRRNSCSPFRNRASFE